MALDDRKYSPTRALLGAITPTPEQLTKFTTPAFTQETLSRQRAQGSGVNKGAAPGATLGDSSGTGVNVNPTVNQAAVKIPETTISTPTALGENIQVTPTRPTQQQTIKPLDTQSYVSNNFMTVPAGYEAKQAEHEKNMAYLRAGYAYDPAERAAQQRSIQLGRLETQLEVGNPQERKAAALLLGLASENRKADLAAGSRENLAREQLGLRQQQLGINQSNLDLQEARQKYEEQKTADKLKLDAQQFGLEKAKSIQAVHKDIGDAFANPMQVDINAAGRIVDSGYQRLVSLGKNPAEAAQEVASSDPRASTLLAQLDTLLASGTPQNDKRVQDLQASLTKLSPWYNNIFTLTSK